MINKLSLKTKNGTEIIDIDTYARWLCLAEAVEVISNKAKMSKIDIDSNNDWIRPIPIQKYVKERFPSMLHNFKVEESLEF